MMDHAWCFSGPDPKRHEQHQDISLLRLHFPHACNLQTPNGAHLSDRRGSSPECSNSRLELVILFLLLPNPNLDVIVSCIANNAQSTLHQRKLKGEYAWLNGVLLRSCVPSQVLSLFFWMIMGQRCRFFFFLVRRPTSSYRSMCTH
jgi:hypothetical protein